MAEADSRSVIERTMASVVQIVALRQGYMGQMAPAWTGSGTIVDPSGLILTNCHVANPRAMGVPAPPADLLAIAITHRSDEPPALTYTAEVAAQSPELDLAVLRITGTLNRQPMGTLNLPSVPLGDSDTLELGDHLDILGYPGIGGDTVTLTSGSVAGFTGESGVAERRAWIKTDATIAGGNSGGTAINQRGELVGIPTQAAAGADVLPVDARPVIDTNRDGRIDQRDTPMAIGGFINGLRPVNLAKPLLRQAGARGTGQAAFPVTPPARPAEIPADRRGIQFSTLVFSAQVTRDGRPVQPAAILPGGVQQIFATVEYTGMRDGLPWKVAWAHEGRAVGGQEGAWDGGAQGRRVIALGSRTPLPDGVYQLTVAVQGQVVAQGEVTVGRSASDTDTQVSGRVVDRVSGRGIPDALVIALRPGVSARAFVARQDRAMIFTSAMTDARGTFTFPQQLPKGQAYGLVVVARGYQDIAIEGALRVGAGAPEQADIGSIALNPE